MDQLEIIQYFFKHDLLDIYPTIKSYVDFINTSNHFENTKPMLFELDFCASFLKNNYSTLYFKTFNNKETNLIIDKITSHSNMTNIKKIIDSELIHYNQQKIKFSIQFFFTNKNEIFKLRNVALITNELLAVGESFHHKTVIYLYRDYQYDIQITEKDLVLKLND